MSLTLKLNTVTQINQPGDRVLLTDTTVYGGTEPLRGDRASFIVGEYKGTKSTGQVIMDPFEPLTSMDFDAIADKDGWYRFYLISVPTVATVEDLEDGMTAYVIDDQSIQRNQGGNIDTRLPADLVGSEFSSLPLDTLFIPNNSKMFNLLNRQVINLRKLDINGRNVREISRVDDILRTVDGVLAGAIYEFQKGDKINAQEDIEFLNSNVDKYIVH